LANISSAIVALSNHQAEELTTQYKIVSSKKLHIIQLGVDEKNLQLNVEENRQQFRSNFT
jgi:hypothetical protein